MKFKFALAAVAAATISSPALADTCGFSITGLNTASFELDCTSTSAYIPKEGISIVYNVPITLDGVSGTGQVNFYSQDLAGGLNLGVYDVGSIGFKGDALFTGSETEPTFVPGDYVGTNGFGGPIIYNISIRNLTATAAAVPEPATWAMMLLGFGAIGVTSRRRRKATAAAV